ncbi:MAG: hypothetical protein MI861_21785, partial [Pirellulales bacterium]|nr:hypothetical protein [Pirellulales bacterium]
MKTHWITSPSGHRQISLGFQRWTAVCGAVLLAVITSANASGQSGLSDRGSSVNGAPGQQVNFGQDSVPVVGTAGFRTAADVSDSADAEIEQVGFARGCRSCGTWRCRSSRRGHSSFAGLANPCAPCEPFWYLTGEALYMERDGEEGFSLSPSFNSGEFDHEFSGRITLGTAPDCVHGYEVSFTGPFEWDKAGAVASPGGNIQTFLFPGPTLVATDLSAFNDNPTSATQTYTSDYWSIEANRTLVGWNIAKLLFGFRYIDYDEEYFYTSQNAIDSGTFSSIVDNQLFGIHAG